MNDRLLSRVRGTMITNSLFLLSPIKWIDLHIYYACWSYGKCTEFLRAKISVGLLQNKYLPRYSKFCITGNSLSPVPHFNCLLCFLQIYQCNRFFILDSVTDNKNANWGRVYPCMCNSIVYKRLEVRNNVDSRCVLTRYLEEAKGTKVFQKLTV